MALLYIKKPNVSLSKFWGGGKQGNVIATKRPRNSTYWWQNRQSIVFPSGASHKNITKVRDNEKLTET